MNKKSFADELQEIIRDSGIRQNIIAQALGISSAAISQFIHGTAIPSDQQLAMILAMLNVNQKSHSLMFKLLQEARTSFPEDQKLTDEDGDNGEEDSDVSKSKKDHINFEKIFTQVKLIDDPTLVFGNSSNGAPVINLHDLYQYAPSINISDFAFMYSHDTMVRDYGTATPPVIIKATGSLLGISYTGMMQLIINNDQRQTVAMELALYPQTGFRLLALNAEALKGLEIFFPDDVRKDEVPVWTLPVVELIFLPFFRDTDDEDDSPEEYGEQS